MKTSKLFINMLLALVAFVLFCLLTPFGIIFSCYVAILETKGVEFLVYCSNVFYSLAFSLDKMGNVLLGPLLNRLCIKSQNVATHVRFGNIKHTISLILGFLHRENNLSTFGKILFTILDLIDKGHCEKAIVSYLDTSLKPSKFNL